MKLYNPFAVHIIKRGGGYYIVRRSIFSFFMLEYFCGENKWSLKSWGAPHFSSAYVAEKLWVEHNEHLQKDKENNKIKYVKTLDKIISP